MDRDILRERLSPDQYEICVNKMTEAPFTGKYFDCKEDGTYLCVCCGAVLFHSDDKFDSGTGWPSFTKPADRNNIQTVPDGSHGMIRTEVTCRCGSHLGHVFDDGPTQSNLRYCINSASLQLKIKERRAEKRP